MRILGIDIGRTSIKAVELDSAFGRYEIHEYHELPVPPGTDPTPHIKKMLDGLQKQPDRIVVAMPTGEVTFRNLQLPTRDKKAIQAGVGFELEDELPFSPEDSVNDYSVLSQGKQGSFVHVAATLKKRLIALLNHWMETGIEPDVVTTEIWAYRSLLNRVVAAAEQESPMILVQIGHEKTTIYCHWRGAPVFSREVSWGGADLTAAICQKYQIPIDQAEHAKLDHGFVIPASKLADSTPEQVEMSKTLMESLQTLIRELRTSELSCKNITHKSLSALYISGGTSLLPGLAAVLEEELHAPVRPLQGLSSIATSGVTYSEHTDATLLLASALALCLVGPDRSAVINFRKGVFSKQGHSRELNLESLKRPLAAAAAVAFCMFLSLTIQSSVYKTRLQDTDAQLERSVKSFFGSLSNSAVKTYMSNTTTLRASINKELSKQRELNKLLAANPHSPIDFLKHLSLNVPSNVVVDMTQYQVGSAPTAPYAPADETTTNLTFIAENAAAAESLKNIVTSKYKGLQAGKTEEDPATKKWKVTFTGKLSEDAYGI